MTVLGNPCAICSGRERYVGGNCVACARKRSKEKHALKGNNCEAKRVDAVRLICDLYKRDYPVQRIVEVTGVSRSWIHKIVHETSGYRLRSWSDSEDMKLREIYSALCGVEPDLDAIALYFGRSYAAVASRAHILELTNMFWKSRMETCAQYSATRKLQFAFGSPHPRGMLGKSHSIEAKKKISEKNRGTVRKSTASQRKTMSIAQAAIIRKTTTATEIYSRTKSGRRSDLGDVFFRSAWEANIARWLNFNGVKWEFEPTTFWFEKIRRGVRSYTPDFYLTEEDRYIEVKGWMDAKSKTKLKRMAKYHPKVNIELLDAGRYKEISKMAQYVIPNWETKLVDLRVPSTKKAKGTTA